VAAVGAAVEQPPALAGGTLFVPTSSGLVALAAGGCGAPTCPLLWSAPAGGPLGVQPAVAGDVVFTGAGSGAVRAFATGGCGAPTCSPLWSADAGAAVTAPPVVSNGRLLVGTADGRVVAYGLLPT
jgi:outer membrane protein assembly factor BamB